MQRRVSIYQPGLPPGGLLRLKAPAGGRLNLEGGGVAGRGVVQLAGHQLGVGSFLHQPAVIQHQDDIGGQNG